MAKNEFPKFINRTFIKNSEHWAVFGETLKEYEFSFQKALAGQSLHDLIQRTPQPVLLDLMSPLSALRVYSWEAEETNRGIGLSVGIEKDTRTEDEVEFDRRLGLDYLQVDLRKLPESFNHIREKLGDNKPNMIFQRGLAGVAELPVDLYFHIQFAQEVFGLLSQGTALLQLPNIAINNEIEFHRETLENALKEKGVNATTFEEKVGEKHVLPVLRIDKLK